MRQSFFCLLIGILGSFLLQPDVLGQTLVHRSGTEGYASFRIPASTNKRDSLTLRISWNDGKNWKRPIPIDETAGTGDHQAYSDLVAMRRRCVGIVYESANYKSVRFRKLRL